MAKDRYLMIDKRRDTDFYRDSYYARISPKGPVFETPDLFGVVNYMVHLNPTVLSTEPTLIGLNQEERKTVMNARERILEERLEH